MLVQLDSHVSTQVGVPDISTQVSKQSLLVQEKHPNIVQQQVT